jgi:hypothetical protein
MLAFTLTGILLLVLGLVLRVGKWVEILAGYKADEYEDKNGLAKWTGNVMLVMGVLSFGAVFVSSWMANKTLGMVMGMLYLIVVMYGGVITLIAGSQKFKKK